MFLHYTILFGVDSIGDWSQIFRVPELGLALLVSNGLIGWVTFQKDKYLSHFFNVIGLLCQLFLLIASVILVALNV